MSILILFLFTSIVWVIVFAPNDNKKEEEATSPLIIVYYPKPGIYAPYDSIRIITQLQHIEIRRGLPFTYFILLCVQQNTENRKDVLYVKSIYNTYWFDRNSMKSLLCTGHFTPSVVRNGFGKGFNAGFYVRDDAMKLKCCRLEKFPNQDEEFEILSDQENSKNYPYTYFPYMQMKSDELASIYRLHIFWISWDKATVTAFQTIHRFVSYRCKVEAPTKCYKYETGENLLNGIADFKSMDYYYSMKNQNDVLNNLIRPKSPLDPSVDEFFDKALLSPRDDFCDNAVKQAACTHLNVVPIWKRIIQGPIRVIEKFIQDIASKLPINTLEVRTIAYDTLKLPLKNSSELRSIYLDSEHNRIPVPRILIKIVDYRFPRAFLQPKVDNSKPTTQNSSQTDQEIVVDKDYQSLPDLTDSAVNDEPESSTQRDQTNQNIKYPAGQYDHYYIALIIHNEIPRGEKICGNNQPYLCTKLGWKLPIDAEISKTVYCCTLDDSKWKQTRLSLPETHKKLDLNKIPLVTDE